MTVGLKGHVMGVAFPEGYSNWQETDLHELIDAELIPEPTDKNVVKAVRKLAKDADSVVIATDYDREGELIGLEALAAGRSTSNPAVADGASSPTRPPIKRARYSALTKDEIERAFSELDELSYDLAYAGAARQDIDLIWGATLTRAVSLATRRFGSNFLSVGRVQSPTLALIVERELERRAHVAKPYWELFANFAAPRRLRSRPTTRPTSSGRRPRPTRRSPGTKSPGVVKEVSSKRNTRKPPTPLNTTAFTTDASSRLGITPGGRDADRRGPLHGRVHLLPAHRQHGLPAARSTRGSWSTSLVRIPGVLGRRRRCSTASCRPPAARRRPPTTRRSTRRRRSTRTRSTGPKRRVYELVVRRFLATFSHADDHRVDPRRHRGRLGDLLRPRLGRRRPRLRRASTPTPARPTTRSRSSRRARAWTSTAIRGSSTRRPSRRRGSARAS